MSWTHYATLRVTGIPKPQPRVKAFRRGNHAGVYTPDSAKSWKQLVMFEAAPLAGRLIDSAIKVSIEFVLSRPKAHKRDVWVTTKPDIDNLEKSTIDALTDCGVWRDDSLVASITSSKSYEDGTKAPGATICIEIWN